MRNFSCLFILIFAIAFSACNDPLLFGPYQINTYSGKVINQENGQALPGIELHFIYYLGGRAVVGQMTTLTNDQGGFRFDFPLNVDSLMALSERFQVDTSLTHQNVYVYDQNYITMRREQNGEIVPPFRYRIDKSSELKLEVLKAGNLHLEMQDTLNPQLQSEVVIRFQSLDLVKDSIDFRIANFNNQVPIWDLPLPSGKQIKMSWDVYEGTLSNNLKLARSGSDTVELTFKQTLAFFLYH